MLAFFLNKKNPLKEIAEQLGKKDWDFNLNPYDGNTNWTTPTIDNKSMYVNNVTCNCSTPDGFCHVQTILLAGQDLAGVLPPSLPGEVTLSQDNVCYGESTLWANPKILGKHDYTTLYEFGK